MASQQVFQAYPQNKGTLIPGQTITVNNYTIQVERYLSQGGFAHVYLVRTPTPVYNTTHHVLKRIAVANESMLTDVKKEVDIMRLLKGHPNIVHLIDAAWHKLPNGTFEVFILMEFCPGGGIIDMMNRRLRERLTEAEILQIFVDVCEGVAYMHNSRPPLLHRDLKVENILQSSPTSFKLCDFGSATTVSNPPANMQEIRALEADLNRHTTLQYRAPEMVDVYSKRPVNEKSDVWALGVLLYKLCYYTTPFEEHGPLAILNVQYRIPPYPIYSQDMNMLIGSILREHGAQRPTVFELLNHVHRLRGTKSKFSYNVPIPPPLLPRTQPNIRPSPSPNSLEGTITYAVPPKKSPLLSYNDPKSISAIPPTNQGIQARDRVLEAIAPMRRGRPTTSKESQASSRPSSPQKSQTLPTGQDLSGAGNDFAAEKDRAWKAATEQTSATGRPSNVVDDAWNMSQLDQDLKKDRKERGDGFGDDFAQKLWNAPDPNSNPSLPPRPSPRPNAVINQKVNDAPATGLLFTGSSNYRPKSDRLLQARDKDAFEGLGLMTNSNAPKIAPTLGEARKLRTGLAIMSTSGGQGDYLQRDPANNPNVPSYRPSPSPQPGYLSTSPFHPQSVSPVPTPGSTHSASYKPPRSNSIASPQSANSDGMQIESRFPSLEELDAQFSPPASAPVNAFYPSAVNDASSRYTSQMSRQTENRSQYSPRISNVGPSGSSGNLLKPSMTPNLSAYSVDGIRSQQVTGFAMREQKDSRRPENNGVGTRPSALELHDGRESTLSSQRDGADLQPRPLLVRKHRSSTSVKPAYPANTGEGPSSNVSSVNLPVPPKLPQRPPVATPAQDWLTGDDQDDMHESTAPPELPVIRDSPSKRASLIENRDFRIVSSAVAQHVEAPAYNIDEPPSADLSPTVSKFRRAFPAVEKFEEPPLAPTQQLSQSPKESWSPIKKDSELESSADEGPEEASMLSTVAQKRQASKARGRQSSVHDLVYQYGGGLVTKEKEKEKERERLPMQYSAAISDYVPLKSRPTGPGLAPPTAAEMGRKTPSPTVNMYITPLTSAVNRPQPPPLATKPQATKPQPIKLQSTKADTKFPASARSRPQSMFIFPSKSVDSSSTVSNSLAPPQEPRPRATRRTSISDMVQRYESIGGSSATEPVGTIPPGPPSPIHRPVSTKANLSSVENGRGLKTFPEQSKAVPPKASVSSSMPLRSVGDPSKARSPSKEPVRQTTGVSKSPSKVHRKFTSEAPAFSQSSDMNTPRPRRISAKTNASSAPSHPRTEFAASRPLKVATPSNSFGVNKSPRKPTIPLVDDASSRKTDEPQSTSPERPYQGVGKLIDQWQKKSAESDQSRGLPSSKRGDILSKRAGIVNGDDR